MFDSDVVISGCGPIGGFTAREFARRGWSVTVLEEHDEVGKPIQCGGIVSPATMDIVDVEDGVWSKVSGATLFSPSGNHFDIDGGETKAVIIDRKRFDTEIAANAIRAGARLELGSRFIDASRFEGGVEVEYEQDGKKKKIRSRLLIGADGFYSITRRRFFKKIPVEVLNGYQVTYLYDQPQERDVEVFFSNSFAPGYFAWSIAWGNFARIGLCTTNRGVGKGSQAPRYCFEEFRKSPFTQHLFEGGQEVSINGGAIPLGMLKEVSKDNIMLVGDAAAQVKPTSGGGIYTGLKCARILVEVADRGLNEGRLERKFLSAYDKKVDREIGKELKRGMRLKTAFLTHMKDHQLERFHSLVSQPHLVEMINKLGDIDHPIPLAMGLLRAEPRLARLVGPYLKSFWHSALHRGPVMA